MNIFESRKRRTSKNVVLSDGGLLADTIWQPYLLRYPTSLISLIRPALAEHVPALNEKFNSYIRYFGYWTATSKDVAYIYAQKKNLVIDLCISRDYAKAIRQVGFDVRRRQNFQDACGWLTGWRIPQSTQDISSVLPWLSIAFDPNLSL